MIEPFFLCYRCGKQYEDAGLADKAPPGRGRHKEKCACCGKKDYGDLYRTAKGGGDDERN